MTAPPEKKAKKESNPNSISMVVEKWKKDQVEQFSAVHRIDGYPFRVRLFKEYSHRSWGRIFLMCEKSRESDLWECSVSAEPDRVTSYYRVGLDSLKEKFHFCSWSRATDEGKFTSCIEPGLTLTVTVTVEDHGDRWRLRPVPTLIGPPDGILVVGGDKKTIEVNKEFLASQSPFFDRLFYGNFKEKNMDEIPIGGVEYEEFAKIIKLLYGSEGVSVKNHNVLSVLDLADRFELKILEDRAVSFLLSNRSNLSPGQKLLAAHYRGHQFLKEKCLGLCSGDGRNSTDQMLRALKGTVEFGMFSDALKAEIFDRLVNGS